MCIQTHSERERGECSGLGQYKRKTGLRQNRYCKMDDCIYRQTLCDVRAILYQFYTTLVPVYN